MQVNDHPKSNFVSLGFFNLSPFSSYIHDFSFLGLLSPTATKSHWNSCGVSARSPPFSLLLTASPVPCFCSVTDDFNYLLTPCTQQIHMINCPGSCWSHHLDGARESKELFSTVTVKTITTAGEDCRCTKGEQGNRPSLDPVDGYLVSRGSHPFFLCETAGSDNICSSKKNPMSPQLGETLCGQFGRQIAALYMKIVVKELEERGWSPYRYIMECIRSRLNVLVLFNDQYKCWRPNRNLPH